MSAPSPDDVQHALARLQASTSPAAEQTALATLQAYPGYRIVLTHFGGEDHLALAPDAEQRQLAAVFTTADAVTAYLNWLGTYTAHKEPPRTLTSPGPVLFPELNTLPLDGLTFDPFGPSEPRSFRPELLRLLAGWPQGGGP